MTGPATRLTVVGQGYVGLPLALAAAEAGLAVVGVDLDPTLVGRLNTGHSHLEDVADTRLKSALAAGTYRASAGFSAVREADAVVVCVPTPLRDASPDLSAVRAAAASVAAEVRPGTLVVLESTSYPGTTEEVFAALLEQESGLDARRDLDVAFSPERVDPGNQTWDVATTPKVVGGLTERAGARAVELYAAFVSEVVPVSSAKAAEMAKLLENTYRHINIALANEMAMLCHDLDIDVWEVIGAAATKPFGFQPFFPGPGVGGHCIPIDPLYLSWRAEQLGSGSRFINLAREINAAMPGYVVRRVQDLLNEHGKPVRDARILLVGVAYKADVGDLRESPALEVIAGLRRLGADVAYADPFVDSLDLRSVPANEVATEAAEADCVVVVTAHSGVDHETIAREARLLLDTRGTVRLRAKHVHAL